MERNGTFQMRLVSGIALLVLLAACAPVQEAPQGITGVWQTTATSSTGQEMSKAFWLEQGTGNTVNVMNDPGGSGTFNDPALHLVFNAGNTSTVLDGSKTGNRITGTYTVTQNGVQTDSGNFSMSFAMHPADLNTNPPGIYASAYGTTYIKFSTPYLRVNPTDNYDASVFWNGSQFVISPGPGAMVFSSAAPATWEDFIVRANVGGPLDMLPAVGPNVVIQPSQLIFVKTRENRFALVYAESIFPGSSVSLRSAYGYGGYSFDSAQTYVQRRKTGSQAIAYYFFMELSDPDTGVPVDPTRIDVTSFRVGTISPPQALYPVKAGARVYDTTYSDNAANIRRQVGMLGQLNVAGLPNGTYGLKAVDILGYTHVGSAYYDNALVPNGPASVTMNPDNTILTVWNPGITELAYAGYQVRFAAYISLAPPAPYANVVYWDTQVLRSSDAGTGTYTFTVPPGAVTFLKTQGPLQVQALVRYFRNNYEVFRHYSDPQPISF